MAGKIDQVGLLYGREQEREPAKAKAEGREGEGGRCEATVSSDFSCVLYFALVCYAPRPVPGPCYAAPW